ncbi:hypothetical protein V5735_03825 (plasmid) [Haladaptatus sp. SPP-AMP-3]|uniref:hypothetical protein n=1 Tax=Haladaptatus sp. SPP-AMP-3 TaxID=3121295 RepID=UPI003C30500E
MRDKIQTYTIVLVVVFSISIPTVDANSADNGSPECHVSNTSEMRIVQSPRGVCVKSSLKNNIVHISVKNPLSRTLQNAGFVVYVDNTRFRRYFSTIYSGELVNKNVNITTGLDTTKDRHTATVSTVGNHTTYSFTEKINASATDEIPTPYIANVTVADGTIDGEPSAVAYVTLVNPSMRRYPTKLFVHTTGTDGSFYAPSPQPNNSTTVKVELLDKRGTKIAGEARLYTGNLTKKQGGLDQVGFVGKAGEDTQQWNESFQSVRPTWMNNHYQYENDTYSQSFGEKLSENRKVGGVPVVYLGLVVLVGLLFVRRWR